jgi:hypothetical protein
MPDNPDLVPGQRIKLSTHINELVRVKLHELADMKEGVILQIFTRKAFNRGDR